MVLLFCIVFLFSFTLSTPECQGSYNLNTVELVVVYTGEAWEAIILRYLLNKDGIKTWLTNKRAEAIGQTSNLPSAWESVTIKVTVLDYERARLIVAKFEEKAQDDKFKFDL